MRTMFTLYVAIIVLGIGLAFWSAASVPA